jgi:hypothetical protein
MMASLFGDKAILEAMRTNEDDTKTAYGRAVQHQDVTLEMRQVLEQNLANERRHCAGSSRRSAECKRRYSPRPVLS